MTAEGSKRQQRTAEDSRGQQNSCNSDAFFSCSHDSHRWAESVGHLAE